MGGADAVRRARQLVIVAEVITRWPAQLRGLRQVVSDRSALHLLDAARHDELAWHRTLGRLRIDNGTDALADLRELLVLCGDDGAVADLFAAVT
jgi:hypothetical protein